MWQLQKAPAIIHTDVHNTSGTHHTQPPATQSLRPHETPLQLLKRLPKEEVKFALCEIRRTQWLGKHHSTTLGKQ
jgi:hypothetical protein